MENMRFEVVEAIEEIYKDDKELIKDCLYYLYNTTNDKKMRYKIEDWFDYNEYCIDCGEQLQSYEWCETHTELDGNPLEWFTCKLCPICDRAEIKSYR